MVLGMLVFALGLLWVIAAAGSGSEQTATDPTRREPRSEVTTGSVEELRADADEALDTAVAARADNRLEEALDAYNAARTRYEAARDSLDAGATEPRAEIDRQLETTREAIAAVEQRATQRTTVTEALTAAEHSFRVGVIAYTEGSQTLARIRFRQARDSFTEANELLETADSDLLTPPVEVQVQPDRDLPSQTLSELPAVPEPVASALADAGVDTVPELESNDGPPWQPTVVETAVADTSVDDAVATTLTLLSWIDDAESHAFATSTAVTRRRDQAAYGFSQST
jgi:hypothetical protein